MPATRLGIQIIYQYAVVPFWVFIISLYVAGDKSWIIRKTGNGFDQLFLHGRTEIKSFDVTSCPSVKVHHWIQWEICSCFGTFVGVCLTTRRCERTIRHFTTTFVMWISSKITHSHLSIHQHAAGVNHYLMIFRSCCLQAKMGRYCLCSNRVLFLAKLLLASLLSFMWSANFCSVLRRHNMDETPTALNDMTRVDIHPNSCSWRTF